MIEELFETLCSMSESLSSARARYLDTKKVEQKVFDALSTADPTSTKKYLEWMLKQYVVDPDSFNKIIQNIQQFDSFVNKEQIQDADINSYRDLAALEVVVQEVAVKGPTKTQKRKSVEKEIKKDKQSVYQDENIEVIVPQSHKQSCLYGAGTKWCTTAKSPVNWHKYYKLHVKLYYIMDKRNNTKFAVGVAPDGGKEVFDAKDKGMTFDSMVRQLGIKVSGFEKIFQPLSDKEIQSRKNTLLQKVLASGKKNSDGSYSFEGNVKLSGMRLKSLPFRLKEVTGNFDCANNQLTSLEGAPEKVGGYFSCVNNQLTSLKGAPREVVGEFTCAVNQLTSLEGAPERVGGDFSCSNNQLTTLEGAPEKVGGYFSCAVNQLTSLEGASREVGGFFNCSRNQLTSLEGAPEKVGGGVIVDNNPVSEDELKKTVDREYL